MNVTLSHSELIHAAMLGMRRQIESLRLHRTPANGYDRSRSQEWGDHIEGACGECAAAKALNLYWNPTINTFHFAPDLNGVARQIEVRTRSKSHYDLIIRKDDDLSSVFILVTGVSPDFHVVGWIIGHDGAIDSNVKEYGGRPKAWFVPQEQLRPIEELAQMVK